MGSIRLNHIMFADDICCFSPSLNDILDCCNSYASKHDIVFNCKKSFGMLFSPHSFKLSQEHQAFLGPEKIRFVDSVKYLGVHLHNSMSDETDIHRQVRSLYCTAKKKN